VFLRLGCWTCCASRGIRTHTFAAFEAADSAVGLRRQRAGLSPYPVSYALALLSYDVLVDSKKFTSCSVSFAVLIHFAGLSTL
jgi:hypothetical protein